MVWNGKQAKGSRKEAERVEEVLRMWTGPRLLLSRGN